MTNKKDKANDIAQKYMCKCPNPVANKVVKCIDCGNRLLRLR
jgi:hypothetical protein